VHRLSRRDFARAFLAAVLLPGPGAKANATKLGLVGAIRWDAWFAPGSVSTEAVTKALAPAKYNWRLPFFANVEDSGQVHLTSITQDLMDLEIEQASFSGLDYWAFVSYSSDSPLSAALHRYLSSPLRSKIAFCMYTALEYWGTSAHPSKMIGEHLQMMQLDSYVKVQGDRPLYYLGFVNEAKAERWGGLDGLAAQIRKFRSQVVSAALGQPYIVLGGDPGTIGFLGPRLGADAVTSYVITDGRKVGSYFDLTSIAEAGWERMAKTDLPVVPIAMSGWDQRPRIEHPGPWNKNANPVDVKFHFDQADPEQIAQHVFRALRWNVARPARLRAPTVLMYAWNEYDEGGWIAPTLGCDMRRLQALNTRIGSSNAKNPKCGSVRVPR
jgi:hypothetical protein